MGVIDYKPEKDMLENENDNETIVRKLNEIQLLLNNMFIVLQELQQEMKKK